MNALAELLGGIHPALILLGGAAFIPFIPEKARGIWSLLVAITGLAVVWLLPEGMHASYQLFGLQLEALRVDALSRIFGIIFHIAAVLCVIYGWQTRDLVHQLCTLTYSGSAIGAVFAGDLLTLFLWWELTAVTSVGVIWARKESVRAWNAGMRYLIIQVTSGVLLLAGAALHVQATGSAEFSHIGVDVAGGWLILFAFGIKCAFPFLHNWLQDAYPEATVTGTVLLSAFSTKMAVYALARGYAGTEFLIPIGAVMTVFPVFFAAIENDMRRVLAYSLNNQLGFMVVGIGIGTELSLNGTAAHAFCHILYKALLFMSMGAVLLRAGTVKTSELGGLVQHMPWTATFCIIGAASISAFPLFSGFVSKSMILDATAQGHHTWIWATLVFASAGVLHHSGIKIPYFAFFGHRQDWGNRVKEAPLSMLIAMGITAFLCVFIGVYPAALYSLLPYPVDYVPYTAGHILIQMQLLMFAVLAFVILMLTNKHPHEVPSTNLDSDWFYRRAGKQLWFATRDLVSATFQTGRTATLKLVNWHIAKITDIATSPDTIRRQRSTAIATWAVMAVLAAVLASALQSSFG